MLQYPCIIILLCNMQPAIDLQDNRYSASCNGFISGEIDSELKKKGFRFERMREAFKQVMKKMAP